MEARRTAYIAQSVADAEKLSSVLLEKRFSFKTSGTQIIGFEDFKHESKSKLTVSKICCCLCYFQASALFDCTADNLGRPMEPIVKGKRGAGERKGGDDTKLSKLGSRTSMFVTKRERRGMTEAVLQDLSRGNGEIYTVNYTS